MTFYDSVGDSTATAPGTGPLTLTGIVPPNIGLFNVASQATDGDISHWRIVDSTNPNVFMLAQGTYASGILTIGTIFFSTNSNAPINFIHPVYIYNVLFPGDDAYKWIPSELLGYGDGSTRTFYLANNLFFNNGIPSIELWVDDARMIYPAAQFTASTDSITFASGFAPQAGSIVWTSYWKA